MNSEFRKLYFLQFPLFLATVGLTAWIFPTDEMLIASSLAAAVVGLYVLWQMFKPSFPIRFTHAFAIAQLFGYGVGVAYSWFTMTRDSIPLAVFFHRDVAAITEAMAGVLFSSALLLCLGEVFEPEISHVSFRFEFDSRLLTVLLAWTALLITAFATGQIGYMGLDSQGGKQINPVFSLVAEAYPVAFGLTALYMMQSRGFTKWALRGLLLLQFVLLVPTGRRNMFYAVLIALLICSRLGAFHRRMAYSRKLIYGAVLLCAAGVSMVAFFYLRSVSPGHGKVSLPERITRAFELYEYGNSAQVNGQMVETLEKRTFLLDYISDLLTASYSKPPAMGADFVHALEASVPTVLWKDKELYKEEDFEEEIYGLVYRDEPKSLLSAGIIDFGFVGMLLYPVIFAAMFRMTAGIVNRNTPASVAVIVTFLLLSNALITESGLAGRFVPLRDALLVTVALLLASWMPRLKWRKQF